MRGTCSTLKMLKTNSDSGEGGRDKRAAMSGHELVAERLDAAGVVLLHARVLRFEGGLGLAHLPKAVRPDLG